MSSPSVDQLLELPLPAAISYAPQTWGWLLVLGVLLLISAAWGMRRLYHWRQDRYRREALAQIDLLARKGDDAALREVPELLKRVALSMPQQPDVARLSGAAWQAFLQNSTPVALPEDFVEQLAALAYAPSLHAFDQAQRQALLGLSRRWVETHHVAT